MLQPHIQLENMGIRCAILPGDPARVPRHISRPTVCISHFP